MPESVRDLDAALADQRLNARIETSMTLKQVARRLNIEPWPYVRDGLGTWNALSVQVDGFGEFVVAAPAHLDDAGCSVWYSPSAAMSEQTVASLLCGLADEDTPLFLDPESGEPVVPDSAVALALIERVQVHDLELHEVRPQEREA